VENGVKIFLLTANGDIRETPTDEYKSKGLIIDVFVCSYDTVY
jgi:hypothetical protein